MVVKEYQKQYYQEHKEELKKRTKKWSQEHQREIEEYREKHKNQAKQYRLIHKKEFKEYRQSRKEEIYEYNKEYNKVHPWMSHYNGSRSRCNNPKNNHYHSYGGRGIKFLMTNNDFRYLWFRDKAFEMKQASIDRIDNDGNYELNNCRFIELIKNTKKKIVEKI